MRLSRLVFVLFLAASAACDGGSPRTPGASRPPDPLTALPECGPAPSPHAGPAPEGLILPRGSVMTSVRETGRRLTQIKGYVEKSPVEIRRFYAALRREPGYDFVLLEDEVIEAEAFFAHGAERIYVRARAECSSRSDLFVILAPRDYRTPRGTRTRD